MEQHSIRNAILIMQIWFPIIVLIKNKKRNIIIPHKNHITRRKKVNEVIDSGMPNRVNFFVFVDFCFLPSHEYNICNGWFYKNARFRFSFIIPDAVFLPFILWWQTDRTPTINFVVFYYVRYKWLPEYPMVNTNCYFIRYVSDCSKLDLH